MSAYPEYSLDIAIAEFFSQTSATREACDTKAKDLVGGKVVPVTVQGNYSYSVCARPEFEFVIVALAREIYGLLAPNASFHGQLGDDGKEPLFVYVMNRIQGISYLDFVLANSFPENSDENFVWLKNAHKAPQELLHCLPPRFYQIIQKCLGLMEAILSLLIVLLYRDFGTCNIMVDGTSCHLTGIIDWAEAEICPFGQNLHSLQALTGALHLKNGWRRYEDEVGDLSAETMKAIKTARIMGLLRSRGFTKRLANMPPATPIRGDKTGRYNMLSLDGFLVNPATRFDDLN
ncbi:hypothetical protein BGZ57DRAFT_1018706 [Hyaloscypha finlandica]|nr:hypothetical protein BGZ57DRAFT_1018706 [Hyaloscypha finlandica]